MAVVLIFCSPCFSAKTFPGVGTFQCGFLDRAGRRGLVPAASCSGLVAGVQGACQCGPYEPKEESTRKPSSGVFRIEGSDEDSMVNETWNGGPYVPFFQDTFAQANGLPLLYNHLSDEKLRDAFTAMITGSKPVVSKIFDAKDTSNYYAVVGQDGTTDPGAVVFLPVFSTQNKTVAATVSMLVTWSTLLTNNVPRNGVLVNVVIENTCGQRYTYRVDPKGSNLKLIGEGDLHDPKFDHMLRQSTYEEYSKIINAATPGAGDDSNDETCQYLFSVYPTTDLEDQYISPFPLIYAGTILAVFLLTSMVFVLYDATVRRRQEKVMAQAIKTNNIVTSLFPTSVRDRLYQSAKRQAEHDTKSGLSNPRCKSSKTQMETFLTGSNEASVFGSEPIADLFACATVIFIDIANFTAWCSERDPSQVFTLLENLYHAFDQIGEPLGIFKVETIGDSYVAVAGLPTPRKDHAVVMVRFAALCIRRMDSLVKELEIVLGPSTGDLQVRIGLHSGPVTAGVLRGAKARFQLFGDTVNTASRMEASGKPSRIHASKETVELLEQANKEHWASERTDVVNLKGKGLLQTYWVHPQKMTGRKTGSNITNSSFSDLDEVASNLSASDLRFLHSNPTEARKHAAKLDRNMRLVNWNVEVLYSLLEKVVASRTAKQRPQDLTIIETNMVDGHLANGLVIDEMTEVLRLPAFDEDRVRSTLQPTAAASLRERMPYVKEQLHDYISNIANLYRDVPFHNFDHASHVIMSAGKLMKRIVNPEAVGFDQSDTETVDRDVQLSREIHRMTYGISSDPLMQFAVVFSALIHDVDHTGLTNKELIDMKAPIAAAYCEKCVAEQNSVDLAWRLLMESKYQDLRACIYSTETELKRFRELIVDAVLATDIADKELQTLRKNRWADAFHEKLTVVDPGDNLEMDRKATIVFEHIIQASDVSHCMQHWHTYQKFNARLFEERYVAYRRGVAGENPPWVGWYKGEIWFYDNYIIPLAQKLHGCGVFGVSYHEYLNYAQQNRLEWERKGEEVVESLRMAVEAKYAGADFEV
jgi:class 3 adenylate cyclase